eukprot:GHVS01075782.1.p1 GENE.GHVS01075782.1~~GHVS01075782.1.p1  ORF type:complete len:424 (+),score=42.45 GHVS01075782.1:82-1353(+)
MSTSREFDAILFGASGYTGRFVVRQLLSSFPPSLRWAIAGRSSSKLEMVLAEEVAEGKSDAEGAAVIIADVDDENSLRDMCRRTRLLISCVGPYRYLGENVVKACVDASTDYLDVCGEPQFLEKIELQYHKEAKEKGCVVISACGFDSVPADFGVQFARAQFADAAIASSIETFLSIDTPRGYSGHLTTYECAVLGMGSQDDLKTIRVAAAANKPKVQKFGKKLIPKGGPYKDHRLPGEFCFLFPGADASVIRRTEEQLTAADSSHKSFQHCCYFNLSSWTGLSKMLLFGGMFKTLSQYEWGRSALLKYPGLFSCGAFSEAGSTKAQIDSASFRIKIFAEGYSKAPPPDTTEWPAPDKHVEVEVKGPDPGYISTSIILVQLALCTLLEREVLPSGGVYTPGFAFTKTTAVSRLSSHGITFEKK